MGARGRNQLYDESNNELTRDVSGKTLNQLYRKSSKSLIQWMKEKRRYGLFKSAFDKRIESVVARKISKNIYAGGTKARPFIKPTLTQKRINELSQNVADYFAANLFK